MLLKFEDLTQVHEKWLKQLFDINNVEFTELCRSRGKRLFRMYDSLRKISETEMERLAASGEGHSEKEMVIRELSCFIRFSIDGFPQEDYILAHDYTIFNKQQVMQSKTCGCFYCLRMFEPSEIVDWCDLAEDTALCPYCGIDSILAEASGFKITEELLRQMNEYWFPNV